jgi:putative DNA primase/helicase
MISASAYQGTKTVIDEMTAFTKKILENLELGTYAWTKCWDAGVRYLNYNPISQKAYQGINALNLEAQALEKGYQDKRWLTYKQTLLLGGHVNRGEKATTIQYWRWQRDVPRLTSNGDPVLDENGKQIKDSVPLVVPQRFFANVFNAEQTSGLEPDLSVRMKNMEERHADAEKIIQNSGANIIYQPHDGAFYRPSNDTIYLPLREQFHTQNDYYATALHELGHWTGHETRLNRDIYNPRGSEAYAREELRAEIASWMIGDKYAIGHDPKNHTAYIGHWVKVLKDEPKELYRACSDADKIVHFLDYERQQQQQKQVEQEAAKGISIHLSAEKSKEVQPEISPEPHQAQETKQATMQTRQYISVPYEEKDEAKELGAKWDKYEKSWYIPSGANMENFKKWPSHEKDIPLTRIQANLPTEERANRTYITVPFAEKNEAKAMGAKWDKKQSSWYIPKEIDPQSFSKWNTTTNQLTQSSPQEEFTKAVREAGLTIQGEAIMNGKMQRVPVEGDHHGQTSGAYKGHLDGHPAGFIQNFKTGFKANWKSSQKTAVITPEEQRQLSKQVAEKQIERDFKLSLTYKNTALKLNAFWEQNQKTGSHPYLDKKEVNAYGVKLNISGDLELSGDEPSQPAQHFSKKGNLLVPILDIDGKIWSVQSISPDGDKYLPKGSTIQGNAFPIGDPKSSDVLLFAEGYSTGATLHELTGLPTIVTFSSGNMPEVAQKYKERYPQKTLVFAGDNDHTKEPNKNVGVLKANEAAERTQGYTLIPSFKKNQQGTDWNDKARLDGKEKTKHDLEIQLFEVEKSVSLKPFLEEIKKNPLITIERDTKGLELSNSGVNHSMLLSIETSPRNDQRIAVVQNTPDMGRSISRSR